MRELQTEDRQDWTDQEKNRIEERVKRPTEEKLLKVQFCDQ